VENDLSPRLKDLSKHLKAMLTKVEKEEEISEITSHAAKAALSAEALDAIVAQKMPDAVYWMEVAGRTPRRVSLHAAPVNVADGLRKYLFEKMHSVVMTSATLCTGGSKTTRPVRGMGAPPMQPAAQAASADVQVREGACLPHWTRREAIYAVTFRLADALPQHVLDAWQSERDRLLAVARAQQRQLIPQEVRKLQELHHDKVQKYLDAGHGSCALRNPDVAKCVADTLIKFDGTRFHLAGWCVMPNHVHAVLQPLPGHDLPEIMHSIKSWTAKAANQILGRVGTFWQSEYYDHLVRDDDDLLNQVEYAWSDADRAGMEAWPWRGRAEEEVAEMMGISTLSACEDQQKHGRGAHATKSEHPAPAADSAFAYIKSRLGVVNEKTLQLGSPFEYEKQATLYIENDLPEPGDVNRFVPAACGKIVKYLQQTNGGAFVLFTSYKMLLDAANRLKDEIEALGYPMLVQGQGAPRKILLERFRGSENAVLFGTSSFWQGIDVQGETLRNVIIVKLPFAVPDEPIIEARLEAIQRSGGNPFMEYSVPEAIIKLKQGFGRLIRSRTDRGIVVLLDSRVTGKRYGKLFLDALPACRRVVVNARP
jgi:REP element-mobilizing transposase RayT